MRVVVVTPPDPVVTLEEAKLHLRVDGDAEDMLITGLVAAATRGLDGPDGWLGRALGVQILRAFIEPSDLCSGYRSGGLELPYPPTRSQDPIVVEAVTPGAGPDLAASYYQLDGPSRRLSIDISAPPWGVTTAVTYTSGSAEIGDEVRCAILLLVGGLFANRESDVIDARAVVAENPAVQRLLSPLRIWRV